VRSFQDYNIFNTINPDTLTPKAPKPMPFPLENFDEDIADAYVKLDRIFHKIKAAKDNPVNKTPARTKRLKSLQYKTKTCIKLLQEISDQCQELWF
jgi:hypothetical protein